MRFLILLAVCISSALAYNLNSYRSYSARARYPDVQLHVGPSSESRSKRDIHLHELDDINDCIRNCTYDMQDRLEGLNDTDADDEIAKSRVLCQALEPVDTCYKLCPDSKLRTLMLDFLPMMKQPCLLGTDKIEELQKTMDCLNTTSDLVSDKCDPVCNDSFSGDNLRVDSRVVLNVDPAFILYDDDKKENTDVLRATCKFLTCEQQCGDPITKEHCGQLGVDVDRKSTSTIFGSIIKIYKDMDALEGSIDECKSLL